MLRLQNFLKEVVLICGACSNEIRFKRELGVYKLPPSKGTH